MKNDTNPNPLHNDGFVHCGTCDEIHDLLAHNNMGGECDESTYRPATDAEINAAIGGE